MPPDPARPGHHQDSSSAMPPDPARPGHHQNPSSAMPPDPAQPGHHQNLSISWSAFLPWSAANSLVTSLAGLQHRESYFGNSGDFVGPPENHQKPPVRGAHDDGRISSKGSAAHSVVTSSAGVQQCRGRGSYSGNSGKCECVSSGIAGAITSTGASPTMTPVSVRW